MTINAVNTYIVPTANNEVTMPSQPAFLAYLSATDFNVTGVGTAFRVGSGNPFTEVFDQNSDFNINGTFTAPVTGKYLLTFMFKLIGTLGSNMIMGAQIVTSNRAYSSHTINAAALDSTSDRVCVLADMDVGDTATYVATAIGLGADTADIQGGGTPLETFVSGFLAT